MFGALSGCAESQSQSQAPRIDSVEISVLQPDQPERFTCPQCRIRFDSAINVGEGIYGPYPMGNILRRDRHGRYWMSRTYQEGSVSVYDSAGKFLQTVSRPGEGPGEMRWVSGMAEGPEGMYLADRWNHRLNVFNDSLRLVRMNPMPVDVRALEALDDGSLAGLTMQAGRRGPGFHIISDSGALVKTVLADTNTSLLRPRGDREAIARAEIRESLHGEIMIAAGRNSDVLVGNAARYLIKVIRNGAVVRDLTSPVNWFDSYAEYSETNRVPLARMRSVVVDEKNRAWVLISLPNPGYRDMGLKAASDGLDPLPQSLARSNSAIEVWDIGSGTLLTGILVAPSLRAFADGRHIYTYIETPDGEVQARVWRLTLEVPESSAAAAPAGRH